ncbi:MAG: hypothetical protein U9N50_14880 [Pseudomonadota bacterium]|nr:hypothetical protein [Pseudomonadota bacterium]
MPHITFIHGIANKPPREKLLENWEAYLEQGGLNLATQGVSTSMVYWADVMYAEPEAPDADFESVEEGLGTAEADEDLAWIKDLPADEKAFVESFHEKLGFDRKSPEGDDFTPPAFEGNEDELEALKFEAIPLPWFIKRRVMKALLKDVHHYLFNTKYSPRAGEEYQVQDHIRKLFVDQLKEDTVDKEGPHVVVSHSMGTVIAYDCLKNVPDCPPISAYMTVGSPLGISEVYDNFNPDYEKRDAFPSDKVAGDWVNVYDRLDPVAFDARIANDYQKGGNKVVLDQRVHNTGKWRHSSYKYYGQQALCNHLKTLLEL